MSFLYFPSRYMYNKTITISKGAILLFARLRLDRRTLTRTLLLAALFFFAAHLYSFTSAAFTHDSLLINQSDDRFAQIALGRFLQPLYWKLRGDIPAPLLVGLFSYAFLGIALCLVVSLLSLRSMLSIALTCSVLTANATLILSGGSYISWMDVYMLSFLLSAACVFVCDRWRFGFLAAPFFLCASLGLYQSYISCAALLFLMLLVKSALSGAAPRVIIRDAFRYLFVLLTGLVLYAAATHLVLRLTGMTLSNAQNSIAQAGQFDGVSILPLIADTYLYPLRYMLAPQTHLSRFCALAVLGVFALGALSFVHLLRTRKVAPASALLALLACALMPFAANAVYFISKGFVHEAMIYAFFLALVFPIFLIEQAACDSCALPLRALRALAAAAVLFIYVCNFVTAHQLYLRRDLEFQSTLSVMTRVIDRIEKFEGYEPGFTPVAILGNLSDSYMSMERPGFDHLSAYGTNNYAVTYVETNTWYLWQTLGYPANLVDTNTHLELARREDVRAIPAFPAKNCCQMIDGVLVVRIGVPGMSY